jgi:hypothetical protein
MPYIYTATKLGYNLFLARKTAYVLQTCSVGLERKAGPNLEFPKCKGLRFREGPSHDKDAAPIYEICYKENDQ